MNKINIDYQFLLVKFPIIFPLIYGFVLYQFPNLETELIIITILLLAETHFGATWPFLLDKKNSDYIKENKIGLIAIPFIIIILSLLGFFFVNKLFLLIFFAANMFHVTRQSFGVCKLYCKDVKENKFQEIFIYLISAIFFFVGFFRFYLPIIEEKDILPMNIFMGIVFIFICIFYLIKYKYSQNFLVFLTGCLVFYPMCFVSNPVHAIIMGVTMHYTQYIYLTYNICNLRKQNQFEKSNVTKINRKLNYFVIVVIYALIMTGFSLFGKSDDIYFKQIIIIPIIGQMLHFYLDSQLWKFSEKYNRDNTLSYLSRFIK
ncbi:MAG: hypothetical protein CBD95_003450 [Flavobacteriales bacterium TMED235]|nr:MAG: hypothetical protein CBD95_003450 [Flavobacteriales bacterium TMED235]|tara:strand:+ start:935 stop:1885 length:951 start_codon:yes stop_codon:yes gene_type:complete